MLISGIMTCTMLLGLFAPQMALESNFGEKLDSQVTGLIVRNWSALIGLMGIMLIYGAFVERVRVFALVIAGTSKAVFIGLILTSGTQYLPFGAGIAVVADSIMVTPYTAYLIAILLRSNGPIVTSAANSR